MSDLLLHIIYDKGKGPSYAVEHPQKDHALNALNKLTGMRTEEIRNIHLYKSIWSSSRWACEEARKDCGSQRRYAWQTIELYAERNSWKIFWCRHCRATRSNFLVQDLQRKVRAPVAAISWRVLQRAFDQIIHDAALQKLRLCLYLTRRLGRFRWSNASRCFRSYIHEADSGDGLDRLRRIEENWEHAIHSDPIQARARLLSGTERKYWRSWIGWVREHRDW